ncbi:hypothetical protein JTE90_010868 [Oedothorax gibbosus]|uniref:tRNA (cytosine(38)-C(5))-methyltransferase n=1 Tax=Oedothorax gibbosus TaxID=931172 RepID=A0AAV6V2V3_9ARAC|nr:hypothetical protein JTE90_010868 [Oedothorax gibbosus]
MRYALEATGISFQVVAAIDINPVSNEIYQHNFGSDNHFQKNLLSFTVADFEKMNADIITMSPPCQPFTRVGLRKDINDTRSSSFLHILKVISLLQKKPMYIFVENVQGFENSIAQSLLLDTLRTCRYQHQEFLLSPQDFGIPNSRLRYYLIASLKTNFPFFESLQILHEMPNMKDHMKFLCSNCVNNKKSSCRTKCPIKHFLEQNSSHHFESYLVPDAVLLKYWAIMDIVNENGYKSCCFTKAYYRYAQGTGSILLPIEDIEEKAVFDLVCQSEDKKEQLHLLKQLRLRYFTPKEIANLMCFPNKFDFPPNVNRKQQYKSLGNSLNIFVVASLLNLLIQDPSENK